MLRRDLVAAGCAAALAAPGRPSTAAAAMFAEGRFAKGICWAAWPAGTPYAECFREAAEAGFRVMEIRVEAAGELSLRSTAGDAERIAAEAKARGIAISSVWALTPSSPSLISDSEEVRRQAIALARKAIALAPALGCDSVLCVPGVLGRGRRFEVTYDVAWRRATAAFGELLPLAAGAGVVLTPENVWSRFLVSPRDMRDFVDQFRSPFVKVHFDTGNILQYGYPEDWILTLGSRIHRVHFKDYKLGAGGVQGRFVPLLEGDVNWKGVLECLGKVGYRGAVTVEAGPAPVAGLSQAMDRILSLV